jgi:pimeloyl-ACP methyl ester carboxylesterase
MTALFFGDSGSALLGIWSQPVAGVERDHGVVLCPPIGQEHVRTHWAMRQAAAALCRAGFHCFRFDWFGVGDSAGALRDASVDRWKEDLATAAQELRDTAGVQRISLVGLRLGATIVALAGSAVRPSAVVLWDPVVDGRGHVASLRTLTREMLTDRKRYWNLDRERVPGRGELVGFDFGDRLISEIEAVEVRAAALPAIPTCLLRSSDEPALRALGDGLRSRADVEIRDTELRAKWTSRDDVEQLLLPGDAIRSLTAFLESHAA